MKKSNNLVYIGIAVFAVGALLALVGLRSTGRAAPAVRPAASVPAGSGDVRTASSGTAAAPASYTIPKGMQAVAVELPAVPGLGGYAKPGDLVNIYATIRNAQPNTRLPVPLTKLVLSDVQVLDVRAPAPGSGGTAVYLLALDVNQAEQVIFYAKYESLWMALTTPGQKPATSPGRSYQNLL